MTPGSTAVQPTDTVLTDQAVRGRGLPWYSAQRSLTFNHPEAVARVTNQQRRRNTSHRQGWCSCVCFQLLMGNCLRSNSIFLYTHHFFDLKPILPGTLLGGVCKARFDLLRHSLGAKASEGALRLRS